MRQYLKPDDQTKVQRIQDTVSVKGDWESHESPALLFLFYSPLALSAQILSLCNVLLTSLQIGPHFRTPNTFQQLNWGTSQACYQTTDKMSHKQILLKAGRAGSRSVPFNIVAICLGSKQQLSRSLRSCFDVFIIFFVSVWCMSTFRSWVASGKGHIRLVYRLTHVRLWGRVSLAAEYWTLMLCVRIRLVPLNMALYHTCFIQGCKWWSHWPKLVFSVISDVKSIIYIYFYNHITPFVQSHVKIKSTMYSCTCSKKPPPTNCETGSEWEKVNTD